MLKLIEVYSPAAGDNAGELLASLDVTENMEPERLEVLAIARALYGDECGYYWHDCGHDEGKPCIQEKIL